MKRLLLGLGLLLAVSCISTDSETQQIKRYYSGFQDGDYSKIKAVLADSVTLISGDNVMPFNPESYYKQFKWDSVFQPKYKLNSITVQHKKRIAKVSLNSMKIKFLQNNAMSCSYEFSFVDGKISKIKELDCPTADWPLWGQRVDSLVQFIEKNHPDLDGFIHDLSMQGAQNYLDAIEAYERHRKTKP
ncbi:hypothetical protein Q2T40_18565 [Winogradskyella maritima]|uniref:Lipoprotein n=1 Tax=Winogradskyella maritima TaxID=1517766 RepID=A0ABV8ADU4_9FLAO|nr:hypothetical protein [Winogradskyella maritima]